MFSRVRALASLTTASGGGVAVCRTVIVEAEGDATELPLNRKLHQRCTLSSVEDVEGPEECGWPGPICHDSVAAMLDEAVADIF